MAMNKICDLELLSWEQHRGVIPEYRHDGSVSSLNPSQNVIVALHLRVPNKEPFTVIVDEKTFEENVLKKEHQSVILEMFDKPKATDSSIRVTPRDQEIGGYEPEFDEDE